MATPLFILFDAAVKSTLLLALALVLTGTLWSTSAAVRRALWAMTLTGSLLIPALSACLPKLPIGHLPLPTLLAPAASPANGGLAADHPNPASAGIELSPRPAAVTQTAVPASVGRGVGDLPPGAWIGLAWLAGLAAALSSRVAGLGRVARLTARAAAVDSPGWRHDLRASCRRVGVRRPVRLLASPCVAAPMTWGAWRPVIVVPAAAAGWSRERRLVVLRHELVHIRRGDWLARQTARLACALYWFNPLVWLAAHRLTVEQERTCDEEVVALGTRPSTYAAHLLAIAGSLGGRPAAARSALAAVDMAERSQMEGRLMRILKNERPPLGRTLVLPAAILVTTLVPAIAAMQPWESPSAPEPSPAATVAAAAEVAGDAALGRLMTRLQELEVQLEPMQRELAVLEARLAPIEAELEGDERRMEPEEVRLAALEDELEPFDSRLHEVEQRLRPFEDEIEEIEARRRPVEKQLAAVAQELEPFERRRAEIERQMEPIEEQLDESERHLEASQQKLERLGEELEKLSQTATGEPATVESIRLRMATVQEEMRPALDRMQKLRERLEPQHKRLRDVGEEARPIHQRMAALHEELEPFHRSLSAVHSRMRPVYEEMSRIHREMEPVHQRMAEVHQAMTPAREEMRARHQRMEPVHREISEVHRRMEPFHRQIMALDKEIRDALQPVFEDVLADQLGAVLAPATALDDAARQLLEAVQIHLDDGRLLLRGSTPELVDILRRALEPARRGEAAQFAAAAERAARLLTDLVVTVPLAA